MTRNVPETAVRHDVVDLLINQHMEIRDLFIEVGSATGEAKLAAFHRLVRLLAVHETVEEQVIRPLTRLYVHGGNGIADDRIAEEHDAKETLVALEKLGPDAPEFARLLSHFRDAVLEHAAKEEAYEFRYLRRHVPAVQLRALTPMVKAAAAVAPTRPHPGVESATVNTLLGPALSIFDRARDWSGKSWDRSKTMRRKEFEHVVREHGKCSGTAPTSVGRHGGGGGIPAGGGARIHSRNHHRV